MTDIERAIKHFQNVRDGAMVVLDGFGHKPNESPTLYKRRKLNAELAISALEKQMPKKTVKGKIKTENDYCPVCHHFVQPPCEKHCSYCGQAVYGSDCG